MKNTSITQKVLLGSVTSDLTLFGLGWGDGGGKSLAGKQKTPYHGGETETPGTFLLPPLSLLFYLFSYPIPLFLIFVDGRS